MTTVAQSTTAIPRAASRERIRLIFGALSLVMFVAQLDQTIVATGLPTIAADLGGVDQVSWVVTAYLLGTAVVGPIYGKMGDVYGRRIVLQTAIIIFLLGSVLCGTSQSMLELILFRLLQGLGGGGLIVVSSAAIADVISPRERGRYMGILGSVAAAATIAGPLLGGFAVDHLSWRWIFYVNLPVGIAAFAVIQIVFRSQSKNESRPIDYVGAVLLAGALSSVILFTTLGGNTFPWGSAQIVGLGLLGLLLFAAFVVNERGADEPVLPLGLFRIRTFAVASAIGFAISIGLYGASTYLPLYLQLVRGLSPSRSGLQIAPMVVAAIVASTLVGRTISRFGRYRTFPIVGMAFAAVALAGLSRLAIETDAWVTTVWMVALGLGIGMTMPVTVLAVQNAVDYKNLGVATSGVNLSRTLGGAFGVALLGAIFTNRLTANVTAAFPHGGALPTTANPAEVRALPSDVRLPYTEAIVHALHPMFLTAAIIAGVGFLIALLMREVPLRRTVRAEADAVSSPLSLANAGSSLSELERGLNTLAQRQMRWQMYEQLAKRAGVACTPAEIWVLARLRERPPMTEEQLAVDLDTGSAHLAHPLAELERKGLVTTEPNGIVEITVTGGRTVERMTAVWREEISELLADWKTEEQGEVEELVGRLARSFVNEMPTPPG